MNNIKRMDIKEFREKGYLQEVNRRFFHPLGLALEVVVEEDGTEKLGGIWDYRDDEEGMIYDESVLSKDEAKKKAAFIEHEFLKRKQIREKN